MPALKGYCPYTEAEELKRKVDNDNVFDVVDSAPAVALCGQNDLGTRVGILGIDSRSGHRSCGDDRGMDAG